MKSLIKWPGGKTSEISKIEKLIPKNKRYVEPFFGGGALFFHLQPERAAINDISSSLIDYYTLVKNQDETLYNLLLSYSKSFENLLKFCFSNYSEIENLYLYYKNKLIDSKCLLSDLFKFTSNLTDKINSGFSEELILDKYEFILYINKMAADKIQRTVVNNNIKAFNGDDLKNNLITGFTSGYYMYFRKVFNDITLNRIVAPSLQYKIANFYFIREYCYGSMFRYNSAGEFNIPYGGMSYNTKNLITKINNMFNPEVEKIFSNTDISCLDFEEFFIKSKINEDDFMFLDPPYDTNFSDYDGNNFTKLDHERLAGCLKDTPAKFILIIKNTDFISKLYTDDFNILSFKNHYQYNVRSRNERNTEHLVITNLTF